MNTIFNLDGRETSDPLVIASKFCDYFSNLSPSLAKKIPISSASAGSFLSGEFSNTIFLEPVLENEIKHITKTFPYGKATGYDNISMSAIKLPSDLISRPFTHIVWFRSR